MSLPATTAKSALAPSEFCVVVLAPYGQDAALMARMLESAEIEVQCVSEMESFLQRLSGCAAGLLTTEALSPDTLSRLQSLLHAQPAWSDVPLILLTPSLDAASYTLLTRTLGNVTIIERPLEAASLLSVVRAALRARQKQYQVRDLLEAAQKRQAEIEALNARLRHSMTETHHRVKNNLQLMSALVEMQILEGTDNIPVGELKRLRVHISTLATVHDILTQEVKNAGEGVALSAKAVLVKLLPLMQNTTVERRIHFELDALLLSVRQCTSLAIITNELVANALKHTQADVEVRLLVRGSTVLLIVSDGGPGFPPDFDPVRAAHTGLDLVLNLTRHDLGGTIHFENKAEGGGYVRLTFPIPLEKVARCSNGSP